MGVKSASENRLALPPSGLAAKRRSTATYECAPIFYGRGSRVRETRAPRGDAA
jgi:hypothetical protein